MDKQSFLSLYERLSRYGWARYHLLHAMQVASLFKTKSHYSLSEWKTVVEAPPFSTDYYCNFTVPFASEFSWGSRSPFFSALSEMLQAQWQRVRKCFSFDLNEPANPVQQSTYTKKKKFLTNRDVIIGIDTRKMNSTYEQAPYSFSSVLDIFSFDDCLHAYFFNTMCPVTWHQLWRYYLCCPS